MSFYYTLAPIASPPESLVSRFHNPVTLAAWYRYGSYCKDTVPAFIVTYGALPEFSVDISEAQIVVIDPESEIPPALQALIAIGPYLFDQTADKPIVMDQGIGGAMCITPHFRLIDFGYEDSSEGKAQLEADCLAATGTNLDKRKSLDDLRTEAWTALKGALLNA